MQLNVRPLEVSEAHFVVDYFYNGSPEFIRGMGADHKLFPPRDEWIEFIKNEIKAPLEAKQYFYVIWLLDNIPVGHCNINYIKFGMEAFMHLHLWSADKRKAGLGSIFVKKSIPFYFDFFKLKNLFCEANAYNPAPNVTLPKLGFQFIKTYETKPGPINYLQDVSRYQLTREKYLELYA